jgi:multiple sugar transport system permease protein
MMRSYKAQKRLRSFLTILALSLVSVTMLIPLWWMISTSFDWAAVTKVPFPPRFWPKQFSLQAYKVTFANIPMLMYIYNTLVVIAGMIAVSASSALLAGYALSKVRFKGAKIVLFAALCVLMIPFETTMIPQFLLFNQLGLTNTYWAFWLPGIIYVMGTFFTKQYMDTMPDALRESALIDGANEYRIFARIYLPLCGPVVATLMVLLFLYGWNDFLWPLLILNDYKKYTIQIGVAMFTYQSGLQQMPAIRMASAVVSVLPVMFIYLFLQRFIVESIAMSGIKQ